MEHRLLGALMIKRLFKKQDPNIAFWEWFVKNSNEYYYNLENKRDYLFDKLGKQLSKINEDLTFEFGSQVENGKREFIISADGIRSSFPDVIKLVENAPTLDKWEIIAFRPRLDIDTIIRFDNGIELGVDDIFFDYEIMEDEKIGVTLYIKGLSESNLEAAVYVLLDTVLGEYDVETKLGYIIRKDLNENISNNSRPLKELPTIVDRQFQTH